MKKGYVWFVVMLGLVFAGIANATSSPLEDAVTAIETQGTTITSAAVAGAVILSALGLFALRFGVRWLIGLWKGTTK